MCESGLNTSEDDFEIVNDGNKNMQPRIDVEGCVEWTEEILSRKEGLLIRLMMIEEI